MTGQATGDGNCDSLVRGACLGGGHATPHRHLRFNPLEQQAGLIHAGFGRVVDVGEHLLTQIGQAPARVIDAFVGQRAQYMRDALACALRVHLVIRRLRHAFEQAVHRRPLGGFGVGLPVCLKVGGQFD
ncbi:hypothetical protein D3C79_766040 [compost metagenome]